MADLDSLIGCKISLISHNDIRYDGTLFSINQTESSIVLKEVQVFGTEDRVTDKAQAVAPSPHVLPFVSFPGQEIKDLYVHEASTPPPAPTQSAEPPAAPKVEKKPQHNNQQGSKPAAHTNNHNNNNRNQQQQQKKEEKPRVAASQAQAEAAPKREAKPSEVGTGGHLLKMRERKNGPSGATAGPVESGTEFNFEEGLKTFKKDEILAEVAGDKEITKYTKDDFFDNFSKTTTGETKARLSAADERKLNQDTFGAIALQSGYRRGGRGGAGRGRGGGRGYYGKGRGRGGHTSSAGAHNA